MCLRIRMMYVVLYGETELVLNPPKWFFHFINTEPLNVILFFISIDMSTKVPIEKHFISCPGVLQQRCIACKSILGIEQLNINLVLVVIMCVRFKWAWILFIVIVAKLSVIAEVYSSLAVWHKEAKIFFLYIYSSFISQLQVYSKANWFLIYVKCDSWSAGTSDPWGKHNHQHKHCLGVWKHHSHWCAFGYHPV